MRSALLISAVLLATSLAGAQIEAPAASTLTPPEGAVFDACVLEDVDRDGDNDLIVAVVRREAPFGRVVQVHLRSDGPAAFASKPDRVVRLTPDVTAFAMVDLGAKHGKDVVLINRAGAWVRSATGDGRAKATRLFAADFIWQLPDEGDVLHWRTGVRDIDGDGLDDLLIPEDGGWRIGLQRREKGAARFDPVVRLAIPEMARARGPESRGALQLRGREKRKEFELRMRGDAQTETGPLLELSESTPAPQFADWDGDGDLDLIARSAESLHIWVQEPGGAFTPSPSLSYPIPVVTDRERQLDVSYSAHVADMNGDARADCLFIAGNRRAKDVRTQILLYVQGSKGRGAAATTAEHPLFGPKGIPAQFLQLAGFVGLPRLEDINGDGRPDLSVTTFRPDLIDTMRAQAGKAIDIGWSVFLNRGGAFAKRSDLQSNLTLKAKGLEGARELVLTRFFPDMTGEGYAEVLVQDAPRRLRMIALRHARGGGIVRSDDPVWEYTWSHDAKVILPARGERWGRELVIRGRRELTHLRFDR